MSPELKSFDRVADVYDETRGLPEAVEAQIADAIANVVREAAPAPHVLETGIGTGRIAIPLAARGVRVTGIDIAPKMLARLRAKTGRVGIALAEAAHPPFRAASFDGLLFVHILHLVPDVTATLEATLPLLRPGGILVHGADDAREGIRDRADEIIRAAAAEVTGIALPGWKPYEASQDVLLRVLGEAGATTMRVPAAEWRGRTSAAKMLSRLARRDFSSAWLIPDDALPEVLRRVEPALDALFGGRDVEHEYPRQFSLVAGCLPA